MAPESRAGRGERRVLLKRALEETPWVSSNDWDSQASDVRMAEQICKAVRVRRPSGQRPTRTLLTRARLVPALLYMFVTWGASA